MEEMLHKLSGQHLIKGKWETLILKIYMQYGGFRMIKKNYISAVAFCTIMFIVCAGMVQFMNMFGLMTHLQNGYISLEDIPVIAILVLFIGGIDDIANTIDRMVDGVANAIGRMVKALFK